mmetsp:Transcript_41381/g.95593  ORF Transcript_41381/g.95593 Transcript_41381/m.95593 type:complete len:145 (+) Transcript_41381:2422-2856(+)
MMGGRGMGMPTTVMSMPNMSSMTSSMSNPNLAGMAAAAAAAGAACAEMEVESVKKLNKPPMVHGPLSTSDGVLGAICTSCYVQTDEVLLCDGIEEKGYACPAEWCFSCAGVTSLPEGDWKCSTCQAATMPDGRKMKLKLKLTLK